MGTEAKTRARIAGTEHAGTLQLEGPELLFRAPGCRLKIDLKGAKVEVAADALRVAAGSSQADFLLGAATAAKWLDRIRNPKGLLDKLGVKPEHAVAVLDVSDAGFLDDLAARLDNPPGSRLKQNLDFVFLGADSPAALGRLAKARTAIRGTGAVWIVYPKGVKSITQDQVLAAIRDLGLKDVKVASFSATHTALKAMIPVAARGK